MSLATRFSEQGWPPARKIQAFPKKRKKRV
jgi:hypothetical protein